MIPLSQQRFGVLGYEPADLQSVDDSVVGLFVSDTPALLQRLRFIPQLGRTEAEDLGINYGTRSSGRKGFYFEGIAYEMNVSDRIITASLSPENLFYDRDKVPFNRHFITQASMDEILQEFQRERFTMMVPK